MLLREYLQSMHSISRRKFTDLVDQKQIFVNRKLVDSYKQEIQNSEQLTVTPATGDSRAGSGQYKINEKVKIS
jgi:RNA-binding protein YlmH